MVQNRDSQGAEIQPAWQFVEGKWEYVPITLPTSEEYSFHNGDNITLDSNFPINDSDVEPISDQDNGSGVITRDGNITTEDEGSDLDEGNLFDDTNISDTDNSAEPADIDIPDFLHSIFNSSPEEFPTEEN